MNSFKEMGGYLDLECHHNTLFHDNGIYVNSARNALRYIIRAKKISNIYAPRFTCPVVWDALKAENCTIHLYEVNDRLEPIIDHVDQQSYIIFNNYFGIQNVLIHQLSNVYLNSIIDNSQAFYAPMMGLASFYSPRKFFGLPDGGVLLTALDTRLNLPQDIFSHQRCEHLLMRHDLGARAGYASFAANDHLLDDLPVEKMSYLTRSLMGNINYAYVKERRRENFEYLHTCLGHKNLLNINLQVEEVPLVYPLLIKTKGLRDFLIKNKIYVARYWPNIEDVSLTNDVINFLQDNLIALPIDQRYDLEDMKYLLSILDKYPI